MRIPIAGEDYELKLPKDHLSYSQIDLYLKCPEKYRRRYDEGVQGPYTVALAEGTVMGKVLERVGKRLLPGKTGKRGKPPALKTAQNWWDKAAAEEFPKVDEWYSENERVVETRGHAFLKGFYAEDEPARMKPVAVEEERTILIAGVPVLLIPDLVEENFVIDYKVARTDRNYKVDDSLQLSLYAYGFEKERVAYMIFRKEKLDHVLLPSERRNPNWQFWLEFTVAQVARAISMEVFPPCLPEENWLCSPKWCEHWKTCFGKAAS